MSKICLSTIQKRNSSIRFESKKYMYKRRLVHIHDKILNNRPTTTCSSGMPFNTSPPFEAQVKFENKTIKCWYNVHTYKIKQYCT